jgi:signal transduction histidine kinase
VIARAVNVLALASVLALVGFTLFARSRRIDLRACEGYERQLRSLLALDFRLTAEVMKARSGLIAHYDGIVQTEAARKRAHRALRGLPGVLRAGGASELARLLEAAERAHARGQPVVERFKRENALLRNSLRFLPVLAGELEHAAAASLPGATREILTELIRDELLLQGWQDSALLRRIDRALETLAGARDASQEPQRGLLESVATHARIVRERTPIVHELTRAITAADDARRTQALMAEFHARRAAAVRVTDADASASFVLALLALSACAASIILRLRNSAATLRRTSDQLSQAVASLRAEQAKQQELSELKSRFVSMTSHEFRTPLSVIMSSSELLEAYGERWSASKKQDHFTRIREAAMAMTRMLDAILMIGRRDAGLLTFEPRPLEIDRFCGEVLEAVGAATGQAQRMIYRGLPAEEQVLADPALLRHVLENLLSNALKYSPTDSSVELNVARENGELRFDVRDRGIGISEEDQRHLFETFHRGKNVGEISGTGLGLSIVRGAVELHGGSVSVQSQLSAGTQFTVRIPCTHGEA